MSDTSTIFEYIELPSKGLIYDENVKSSTSLRSMKTKEEMQLLTPTQDYPNKVLAEIIDECLKDKIGINTYDLSIADYQYLLVKLRTISYGNFFGINYTCPNCGEQCEGQADLDTLDVNQIDEEQFNKLKTIELPVSKKIVELTYQTPRTIDLINIKNKERQKKLKTNTNFSILYRILLSIKTIDGEKQSEVDLENFIMNLYMKDTNLLLERIDELNGCFGIDNNIICKCDKCGYEAVLPFQFNLQFFRPNSNKRW